MNKVRVDVARLCCHALLQNVFPFPKDNTQHKLHRQKLDTWLAAARISVQPMRCVVDVRSSLVKMISVDRLIKLLYGSNGVLNPLDITCVTLDTGEILICIDNVCVGVDGEEHRLEIHLPSL